MIGVSSRSGILFRCVLTRRKSPDSRIVLLVLAVPGRTLVLPNCYHRAASACVERYANISGLSITMKKVWEGIDVPPHTHRQASLSSMPFALLRTYPDIVPVVSWSVRDED